MFDLTRQERQVILFLISVALLGLGISFALKVNPYVERLIKVDNNIIKIDINRVNLEDLSDVQGITCKLAKAIIEYRNRNGRFEDITELKEIKGIGKLRYEKLKELFFVR